jgi:glycosyltransferase involved in cell wall biosynthesis
MLLLTRSSLETLRDQLDELMPESISVVVTCHNLENYIGLAIESVLKQDFRGPVEVVVIDDCSTDRSAEIIKLYGNVRYLRPDRNLGVLMASVLGLESTTGELVFFLDGDDVWESSKLSAVVERFSADARLALVTHDLKYIDSSGHLLDRKSRPAEVMAAVPSSRADAVTRDGILLHSDYVWLGSAYAVHRTLGNLKEFCTFAKGLPDPFNTYQDWPLAFWVASQPEVSCGYVNRKLFGYRLHGSNHSGDATSVPKAVRNVRRARNTMQAICVIAEQFNADARVHEVTNRKLRFYVYMDDLYTGHRWRAARGLLVSLPYLLTGTSSFWKEMARFVAVQLLGVERFIGLPRAKKSSIST